MTKEQPGKRMQHVAKWEFPTGGKPRLRQAVLHHVHPHPRCHITSMPGKPAKGGDVRINFHRICHRIFQDACLEKSGDTSPGNICCFAFEPECMVRCSFS